MYNFFTFSQDGENFLKYDSGPGNNRILIFNTTKNLEVLAEASSWFIGATFKLVPDIFYQMLTVSREVAYRMDYPPGVCLDA